MAGIMRDLSSPYSVVLSANTPKDEGLSQLLPSWGPRRPWGPYDTIPGAPSCSL